MTLGELKSSLVSVTGLTDNTLLLNLINLAAQEVWASSDFQGQLRVQAFTVGDQNQVTLPYYVQYVRGIRYLDGSIVNLTPVTSMFSDDEWIQSQLTWRFLKYTPLAVAITNVTNLTVSLKTAQSEAVDIYLSGITDVASSASETLTIPPGETSVSSKYAYEDLTGFGKSIITSADVELRSKDGTVLSILPNNCLEVKYPLIQVADPYYGRALQSRMVLVLYKPTLGRLNSDGDFLEDNLATVVLWKASELYKLMTKDGLEQAGVFAQKAMGLYQIFGKDATRGQMLKLNSVRSPFTTSAGFRGL